VLLAVFVESYGAAEAGVPYPLVFLALPFVLDRDTREAVPATVRTSLLVWVQENPGIATYFPELAADLVPYTREALLFATARGLLALAPGGRVRRPSPRALATRSLEMESPEVAECVRKSRQLGKWLARAGNEHTIFATLGVRP
jgi:hypothetical protein